MKRSDILRKTMVFLLAGGQGERLYPLTKERAKPMVRFAGAYRIIDFTLSNCINSDLRKVHIIPQYMSASLIRHIRLGWDIFPGELGEFIDILPPQLRISEHWYLGTADAVFQNIYTLQEEQPERVLLLSGDHVYKMDYSKMLEFHKDQEAHLTIACVESDLENAKQLGVVEVNRQGRIISFEEKPDSPKPLPHKPSRCLVSMGVYVWDTRKLVFEVIKDAKRDSHHDFGKDIIPSMIQRDRVYAYPFSEANQEGNYWRDIGTIESYWQAHMDLVQDKPTLDLHDPQWPIRGYQEQYPPARLLGKQSKSSRTSSDLQITNSLISAGCVVIGGVINHSILSPGVKVSPRSEISDCIIMERTQIGKEVQLRKVIVDRDIVIPDGTEIGFDLKRDRRSFTVTDSGIVIVPKGTKL